MPTRVGTGSCTGIVLPDRMEDCVGQKHHIRASGVYIDMPLLIPERIVLVGCDAELRKLLGDLGFRTFSWF